MDNILESLRILPSIVITLIVLTGATLGLLFGLLRGFKRSIVTIIGTTTSAVLAFILAKPLTRLIARTALDSFDWKSMITGIEDVLEASPTLEEFIGVLPTVIIAPMVFIVLFVIIKLIMKIPCGIISLRMGEKSDRRALGMPIGAVQGIISSLVIVFVITGFISTADNVFEAVKKDTSSSTVEIRNTIEDVDVVIEAAKKDPIARVLCRKASEKSELSTSVNFVFSDLTTSKLRNDKFKLNEELVNIIDMATSITPIISNTDISTWSDSEIEALDTFALKMDRSVLLKNIGTDLISGACTKWSNGETFMGIERPKADEMMDPMILAVLDAFKETTTDTIYDDFKTVIDLLGTFNKYDVFSKLSGGNTDNLMSLFSGDMIKDTLTVLNSNPHGHFNKLQGAVSNLGLRVLGGILNLPEDEAEIYEDLMNDIAVELNNIVGDGVTEEEITQLASETKTILLKNGIDISEEAAEVVTIGIVEKFADFEGEISAENVQEFFREFSVAYDSAGDLIPDSEGAFAGIANLAGNSGTQTLDVSSEIDLYEMTYSEKLEVLSQLGVYDHYNTLYSLSESAPDQMLSNGKTAEGYVEYIIRITFMVANNRDQLVGVDSDKRPAVTTLSSPETMVTTKVTIKSMMIETDIQLSEEDIEQIGAGFEAITQFMDSYSALGGGELSLEQLAQLDMAAAGKALDSLKSVSAFSGTVDQISSAVVSQVAGTNVDLVSKMNEGNVTYEELFTTVKTTAVVVGNITNADATDEEKEEAILELLLSLTPETAGVVNEIITVDFVKQQGVPADIAEVSVKSLRKAFVEMAALSEEEHETESKYITKMFELSLYAKDAEKKKNIVGEGGLFASEEELIDMSMASNVAYVALREICIDKNGMPVYDALKLADDLTETNKQKIVNYLNAMYEEAKQDGSTAEEIKELEEKINMVSYLLVLKVDFIN